MRNFVIIQKVKTLGQNMIEIGKILTSHLTNKGNVFLLYYRKYPQILLKKVSRF